MVAQAIVALGRRWPSMIDEAMDAVVISFAGWTVFYQMALALQFSMLWAGWPWLIITVLLAVIRCRRELYRPTDVMADEPRGARQLAAGTRASSPDVSTPATARRRRTLVGGALAVVVALLGRDVWGVWPAALAASIMLVLQLWSTVVGPPRQRPVAGARPSPAAHVFALIASIGFGVIGSFLLRPDADDVYYVNRATWVANYGTAALNDTMFGPNVDQSATSAGIPTPSIEAAQGVLAHLLGVEAPTLCYLIAVPTLGFLAGWTTWRLIREWASRRWALAMAASMLLLLTGAGSIVGSYSLGRIWQGKASAFLIVLPLVWMFLARTVAGVRRSDLFMLVCAGVAFVGLTTSSSLLAPLVACAAWLAALILRSKSLALGATAFVAAPVATGIVQYFGATAIGGTDDGTVSSLDAFAIVFGSSLPMMLLILAAVILAPQLAPGSVGVLLGCGALATMVVLLPGVFQLADLLTGAGPVAWRLAITLPTWVLVGLLTACPGLGRGQHVRAGNETNAAAPRARRFRMPVDSAVVVLVFAIPLIFGTWLWNDGGARLTARPTWKVDQQALADVRVAQQRTVPPGRWLMPPEQMQILAISTITPSAVVPRAYYLGNLEQSHQELSDRVALFRLASGQPVPVLTVRQAIRRLDVSLACVREQDSVSREILSRAVEHDLRPVGDMRCHIAGPNP